MFQESQVISDEATGEHRSLGCNILVGVCAIGHAYAGLQGVAAGLRGLGSPRMG